MTTDDTRTRILEAAGPVFAERGFQSATVREICEAAGVNVASINYHFGDKEQLYIETVRRAHENRVQQAPLEEHSAGTSAELRLRDFIRTMITRMVGIETAPWQTRLMLREVLQPTAACRAVVESFFRPQFGRLLDILREMAPAGTPRHKLQQIGFSIVGQCVYYRVASEIVTMLVGEEQRRLHYKMQDLAAHIAEFSCLALRGMEREVSEAGDQDREAGIPL